MHVGFAADWWLLPAHFSVFSDFPLEVLVVQQPMPSALSHLPMQGQSPAVVALSCPGIT